MAKTRKLRCGRGGCRKLRATDAEACAECMVHIEAERERHRVIAEQRERLTRLARYD